jgi:hypothetical protein
MNDRVGRVVPAGGLDAQAGIGALTEGDEVVAASTAVQQVAAVAGARQSPNDEAVRVPRRRPA